MRAEVTGLVRTGESAVHLDTVAGQAYRLNLSGDAELIAGLNGDSIAVRGLRVGESIWVKEWQVVTGADGSAPYLGRLVRHGANLVLEDRNSGGRFVFDESSYKNLEGEAGNIVLVRGFVVGPHVLHVMDWKVLEPKGP